MVLAGWFYIIRRHITVETPLDKRNLERRDRIFVRTTRVKNHPEPPADYFSSFLRLFLRLEARSEPRSSLCLSHTHTFLFLHVSAKWPNENENSATRRRESKIREKSFFFFDIFFPKKKNHFLERKKIIFEREGKIVCHGGDGYFDLLSRRTDVGETDFKSEKMGSNATKGFTRLALPHHRLI